MKPYGDRVLLLMDKAPTRTESGLFIPETASADGQVEIGTVVEVSEHGALLPSGEYSEPAVKVGDKVLVRYFAGTELKIDGVEHQLFRESDIYAIVED
jgi:chaperonin GroES